MQNITKLMQFNMQNMQKNMSKNMQTSFQYAEYWQVYILHILHIYRAKKMNNSHCPALRRRRRGEAAPSGEAASWLHWKGKVRFIARFRLSYPASRVSGRGPARAPAGLGKPKLLLIYTPHFADVTCHYFGTYSVRTGMYWSVLFYISCTGLYSVRTCTNRPGFRTGTH